MPKSMIVLWLVATLAACANPNAKGDGESGSQEQVDQTHYPAAGRYEVLVSRDAAGLSASSGSFQPADSVCVSADQAANPRRLILAARADCDDTHLRMEGGSISGDLRCAAPGSDAKNVPVDVYGVYRRDYWRITEETRIFGQTQREERIYRRTGDCRAG